MYSVLAKLKTRQLSVAFVIFATAGVTYVFLRNSSGFPVLVCS